MTRLIVTSSMMLMPEMHVYSLVSQTRYTCSLIETEPLARNIIQCIVYRSTTQRHFQDSFKNAHVKLHINGSLEKNASLYMKFFLLQNFKHSIIFLPKFHKYFTICVDNS